MRDKRFMGINYWIPLTLLFQSVFIYLLTRERHYIPYVLFVGSYQVYQLLDTNALSHWMPLFTHQPLHEDLIKISLLCCGFFYVLFAKIILRSKKYAPRIHQLMNLHLFLGIPTIFLAVISQSTLVEYLVMSYLLIGLVWSWLANIFALIEGYKPARYYFMGAIALVVGLVCAFSVDSSFFPRTLLTSNIGQIAVGLDMFMQAIALSAQLSIRKEEELKTQAELLRQKDLNAQAQTQSLFKQQQLIEAYERFVPHSFLNIMQKNNVVDIKLGDQIEKEMTVLFADIRNFTHIIEAKTPADSFRFINNYLAELAPVIRQFNGYIDKYTGDGLMGLFEHTPDDATRAAIELMRVLARMNQNNIYEQNNVIDMGIGIHFGALMVGTVGEQERMDGTVISDTVNTAARLESMNKIYKSNIIMSEKTLNSLKNKNQYNIRFLDRAPLKGKVQPVNLYEVFDADPPQIVEKKLLIQNDYEKALHCYDAELYSDAMVYLDRCKEILPADNVINLYLERCNHLLYNKPPEVENTVFIKNYA